MRTATWRHRLSTGAAVVAAVVLLVLVAAGGARVRLDTSLDAFLPSGDGTAQQLQQKADAFGGDPVIALLETKRPRVLFSDSDQLMKLLELEGRLAKLDDVAAVYGPATVLNQTAGSAQDMLAQLSGRRDAYQQEAVAAAKQGGATAAQARAAGQHALAQFDARYGSLLVEAMPAGLPTLKNPKFVDSVLFDAAGQPRPEWHFVVPNPNAVAILIRPRADLDQDAASRLTARVRAAVKASGLKLSRTTVTGVPALEAALTDRARREAPYLGGISLLAVGAVFLLSPWTIRRRSRLRPVIAAVLGTLVTAGLFGWFHPRLSFGVIAFLPILLGIGSDFPLYVARGGRDRATLAAAAAGIVGFASLLLSPLPFVHELGLALAIGLSVTVVISFAMRRWLGAVPTRHEPLTAPTPSPLPRILTAVAVVALIAVGWSVLPRLTVEAQPDQLARGVPELSAATYAENMLRSTGEVSVVLRGKDVSSPAALAWGRSVEDRIVRRLGDRVQPVISLADLFRFLGTDPTTAQVQAATQIMPSYLTAAVLRSDGRESVIVLGARFDDVGELARTVDQIRAIVAHPPHGTSVQVVGLPVAAARGLQLVSESRIWLNLAGIAVAGLVLLVALRRRDALRMVLTVLLATGCVALIAAATTGTLNPLTVAVGSLITATGCEFAVMLAGRSSVRAVATTAMAGTVGYLVIGLSQLQVLRDFGLLLAAGVACSFLAALLVTRVLLPVGRPVAAEEPSVATERVEALV